MDKKEHFVIIDGYKKRIQKGNQVIREEVRPKAKQKHFISLFPLLFLAHFLPFKIHYGSTKKICTYSSIWIYRSITWNYVIHEGATERTAGPSPGRWICLQWTYCANKHIVSNQPYIQLIAIVQITSGLHEGISSNFRIASLLATNTCNVSSSHIKWEDTTYF